MEGNVVTAARWVGLSLVVSAAVVGISWQRHSVVSPDLAEGHRPSPTDARKHRVGILLVVDPQVDAEGREVTELIRRSAATELTGGLSRFGVAVEEVTDLELRDYLQRQPEAASQPLSDVAKGLSAAWLARLTVRRMGIYEPGTGKQLLRFRVSMRVETWGGEPSSRGDREYAEEYPRSALVPAEEFRMPSFRKEFAAHVGRGLTQQLRGCEPGITTE